MRSPEWLGFRGKTLWDWLQLLIVPAILIGVTLVWSFSQTRSDNRREDRRIAADNAREDRRIAADRAAAEEARQDATLQGYLDQMSDLMLHEKLLTSNDGDPVGRIARSVTLATLRRLDGERKGEVLAFVYGARLLHKGRVKIFLGDADLRGATVDRLYLGYAVLNRVDLRGAKFGRVILSYADLEGANLKGADLGRADLKEANLEFANLEEANLEGANLIDANLAGADVRGANFRRANLSGVNLQDAKLGGADLRGANLKGTDLRGASLKDPDSGLFPQGLDLVRYLAALTPLQQKEVLVETNAFLDSLTPQELAEFNLTPEKLARIRREASGG